MKQGACWTRRLMLVAGLICFVSILWGKADDPNPPDETVKLIFIHHSCGENWLSDWHGELGLALADNNYFVSDVNYGWGPDNIGDNTDIGHWWTWFRGADSATYMNALYNESDQHCSYSRLDTDPGGTNEIVMFKSCYPNSNLGGNPNDPPTTGENPLRGEGSWSEHHTVANAKGIYNDLLTYFASRQDKLFIVITAPPVQDGTWADNARAFNTWLVQNWLTGYAHNNVAVFDFYNVLTSNGGDWETNDLGQDTGNHHRFRNGAVQYVTNQGGNTAAYSNGDDHPSPAGNLKGTGEFVPLLNIFYHRWKDGAEPCSINLTSFNDAGIWCPGLSAEITWTSENTSGSVRLAYSTNNGSNWTPIVSSTTDDGSYLWLIPNAPSSRCLVRVCDAADESCCDESASLFTICAGPQAEFSGTPQEGEGQSCDVSFVDHSTGCITAWHWDFGDGTSSFQQHPQHTFDCGEMYAIGLIVSGPCGADTVSKEDHISCVCPCEITLASPDGGERWCSGESEEIRWTSEAVGGDVRIEYSLNGGLTWDVAVASTPDDGSYQWTVPDETSTDCLVRITDVSDPECGDASAGVFQICQCGYIEITTAHLPDGGSGCPYEVTLELTGGCPPFSWSIMAGQLPEGLELERSSGNISGIVTETGTYDVTFMVQDDLDNSDSREFTLFVGEHSDIKGDVDQNCAVNILDVITAVNFILELQEPFPGQQWCADCNGLNGHCDGDGVINILDAIKIVGIILATDTCP